MKRIKTTISRSKYFLLALLVAFSFSCSPEDGNDGATGAIGPAGTNGTNGEDGNANVQTFVFDTATESGIGINLDVPQITQDVLDNDVILSYYESSTGIYYQMPGGANNAIFVTRPFAFVNSFDIRFHDWDGTSYSITAGDVVKVKIIIIESTSTTAGKISGKQQVYNALNQAGVNINDYYAVCDYYGVAH